MGERGIWVAIVLVLQACSAEAPLPPPAGETWWERPDPSTSWWKGAKDPKPAELGRCDQLAPGYATIRVSELQATSNFVGRIAGCDIDFIWASRWPVQALQKQLSRMPGCFGCEFERFEEGFTLVDSVLHLRIVRRDDRLIATFDARWRPNLDEVLFGEVPLYYGRPEHALRPGALHSEMALRSEMAVLRSDCPDGSYARRCLRLGDDSALPEASP